MCIVLQAPVVVFPSCVVLFLVAFLLCDCGRFLLFNSLPLFSLFYLLSPLVWYKFMSLLFECVKSCVIRSYRYALFTGLRFVVPVLPVLPVILCYSCCSIIIVGIVSLSCCIVFLSVCCAPCLLCIRSRTHIYTHADTHPPPHPGIPTPLRSLSIHIITPHTPHL